jgi:hypothetical protein
MAAVAAGSGAGGGCGGADNPKGLCWNRITKHWSVFVYSPAVSASRVKGQCWYNGVRSDRIYLAYYADKVDAEAALRKAQKYIDAESKTATWSPAAIKRALAVVIDQARAAAANTRASHGGYPRAVIWNKNNKHWMAYVYSPAVSGAGR